MRAMAGLRSGSLVGLEVCCARNGDGTLPASNIYGFMLFAVIQNADKNILYHCTPLHGGVYVQ